MVISHDRPENPEPTPDETGKKMRYEIITGHRRTDAPTAIVDPGDVGAALASALVECRNRILISGLRFFGSTDDLQRQNEGSGVVRCGFRKTYRPTRPGNTRGQTDDPVPAGITDFRTQGGWMRAPGGRIPLRCLVRPVYVVVTDVPAEDQPEMPFADDQHPAQAPAAGIDRVGASARRHAIPSRCIPPCIAGCIRRELRKSAAVTQARNCGRGGIAQALAGSCPEPRMVGARWWLLRFHVHRGTRPDRFGPSAERVRGLI
jgi:hypothetical protein